MTDARRYPSRPIVGVGAVIFATDGRVVLVRRGQEPRIGTWTLPGGVVEPAETLDQAVMREVAEETGLLVAAGPLVEVVEHIERDHDGRAAFHFVILDYLCRLRGGLMRASSDACDIRLATAPELNDPAIDERTRIVVSRARVIAEADRSSRPDPVGTDGAAASNR